MSTSAFLVKARQHLSAGACLIALSANLATPMPAAAQSSADAKTASPIKHVIVIIGENRSFDHVYATYQPKKGQTVSNLLSKGIINADGSKGPHYSLSAQYSAVDTTTFSISPGGKTLYANVPPVVAGGPTTPLLFVGR